MSSLDANNGEKQDAKRGRRKFRQEIQRRMWKVAVRRIGMFARPAQLHAEARLLTDRYMHNLDHAPARVAPHLSPNEAPPREAEKVAEVATA